MPKFLDFGARFFGSDPFSLFGFALFGQRELPVERQCGFHRYEWTASANPAREPVVEPLRFGFANSNVHHDVRRTQRIEPAASHFWIWIVRRGYHARNTCLNQCLSACTGAPDDVAWLECDVGRGAARVFRRRFQRGYFGMIAQVVLMKPFADDLSFVNLSLHNHATDGGIGTGGAHTLARKLQRMLHEANVMLVHASVKERSGVGFGIEQIG